MCEKFCFKSKLQNVEAKNLAHSSTKIYPFTFTLAFFLMHFILSTSGWEILDDEGDTRSKEKNESRNEEWS